jgi:hypothetical protein
MTTKAKNFGFLIQNDFQKNLVVWELLGGMPETCDLN